MQINSQNLLWSKESKTLSCFASDIGLGVGCWPMKMSVVSHRTGMIETFERSKNVYSSENEHTMTMYEPVNKKILCALCVMND